MWVVLYVVDIALPALTTVAYYAMVVSWLAVGMGWALVWLRSRLS
jgi:hypothetical protein